MDIFNLKTYDEYRRSTNMSTLQVLTSEERREILAKIVWNQPQAFTADTDTFPAIKVVPMFTVIAVVPAPLAIVTPAGSVQL